MRAVRVHGPADLRIDEIAEPVIGASDVIVKVAVAGICGSDVTFARIGGVAAPTREPFGLGHELAGTIVQVGDAVRGISIGQRVIVNPMGDGNAIGNGIPDGAFAPLLRVCNATVGGAIHPIPDGLAFEHAALAEPLSVGLHAVNRSGCAPGDRVVVFGAGPIGLGIVLFLKERGITDIAVVDMSDQRLERARRLGAVVTINPANSDVAAELGEAYGAGNVFGWPVVQANIWFEVSGAAAALQSIIRLAPFHARMVVVAVHHEPVPVDFQMALGKEMSIVTSMAYPDEFPEVIRALTSGRIDLDPLISHRFGFAQFMHAFAVAQDRSLSAKVMVNCNE